LFTDASGPKIAGAVGVGPTDPTAAAKNAMSMPNIPGNSQTKVVANNPYIPKDAGGTFSMMDFLPEATRITKVGGEIVGNATFSNKYYKNMPTTAELDALGLKVKYKGELLLDYQDIKFLTTEGTRIPTDKMRTVVFIKKGSQ
jgi:filamentous hemagglutinin